MHTVNIQGNKYIKYSNMQGAVKNVILGNGMCCVLFASQATALRETSLKC